MSILHLFASIISLCAHAHAGDPVPCEAALTKAVRPPFEIKASDRVPEDAEFYRAYATHITKPGGLLDQLGIKMNPQVIEFLPGVDLNAITSGTVGGYPLPHYLDGAGIMKALKGKGKYLEVVYSGPYWNHGFYRDDNRRRQQISIIDHVVGHGMFAYYSTLQHYRAGQGMAASLRLTALMTRLYAEYDKDEVQRFYLWALTLAGMVDMTAPLYQHSSEFEPGRAMGTPDYLGRNVRRVLKHPAKPTENVLPAFAANLDPTQPPWKREMLDLIAETLAASPGILHTQIMNEGFASIMQEILTQNSDVNSNSTFMIGAQHVLQSLTRVDFNNPYSLGVICWRHLRERIHKQPAFKDRPLIERDREFFRVAAEDIIGRMTDDQFLRAYLDQDLIDARRFAIVRPATKEEIKPDLNQPPAHLKDELAPYVIVSRSADRLVRYVTDMVIKPKYIYRPRVKLVDLRRPATGEVELVLDDEYGRKWPLRKISLAPALFAMANVIGAPISLEARLLPKLDPEAETVPPLVHARVVVSAYGDVSVYRLGPADRVAKRETTVRESGGIGEEFDPDLTDELTQTLRAYVDDLYLDHPESEKALFEHNPKLKRTAGLAMAKQSYDVDVEAVISNAPGAAQALLDYARVVDRRLLASLSRATKTGRGISVRGDTINVKALPSVVRIEFEPGYIDYLEGQKPPDPVGIFNGINRTTAFTREFDPDDPLPGAARGFVDGQLAFVSPANGRPGDNVWGPKPPGGGGGGGKSPSEGKPQPADPEDPTTVEVPEDVYAQFLGERATLPNLSRKPGEARTWRLRKGKMRSQRSGELLVAETMQNALRKGMEQALLDGVDPTDDPQDTLERGLALMNPRDYRVRGEKMAITRENKAVITFIRDASGSTMRYTEGFKQFVRDFSTLINQRYDGFELRFVTFTETAKLHQTLEEFLAVAWDGGTKHEAGLKMARDDLRDNYPRAVWDRFVFLMGDLEEKPEPTMSLIREMLDEIEFFGTVAGINHGGVLAHLLGPLRQEAAQSKKVGFTLLNPDGTYTIDHLREVLKNESVD